MASCPKCGGAVYAMDRPLGVPPGTPRPKRCRRCGPLAYAPPVPVGYGESRAVNLTGETIVIDSLTEYGKFAMEKAANDRRRA